MTPDRLGVAEGFTLPPRSAAPAPPPPAPRLPERPFLRLLTLSECEVLSAGSLSRSPRKPEHVEVNLLNQYRKDGGDIHLHRVQLHPGQAGAAQLKLNGISGPRRGLGAARLPSWHKFIRIVKNTA